MTLTVAVLELFSILMTYYNLFPHPCLTGKLIVCYDDNLITIDGTTDLSFTEVCTPPYYCTAEGALYLQTCIYLIKHLYVYLDACIFVY